MIVVGLTGGIGSGKTTVLNFFKELGVSCYIADVEAKKLMNTSLEIKKEICSLLGDEAYGVNGLNRKYIASIVFKNTSLLQQLNAIVHPRVYQDFKRFVANATSDYVVYENAILLEGKSKDLCDKIITVIAPLKIRVARVMLRDAATEDEVLARIKNQISDEERVAQSDFVIENIDREQTRQNVMKIHTQLLKK